MSRILLVNPNTHASPYPVYPLGLCYIAAALDTIGHEVRIVDLGDAEADLGRDVETFAPDYVGLSVRNIDDVDSASRRFLASEPIAVARRIKSMTSAPLIVGGSGFSIFPRQILDQTGADFGVRGEGEEAMPALIEALDGRRAYDAIPGLVFRSGSAITCVSGNGAARLPLPMRPEPMVRNYLLSSSMLNVQTQRGCPYTCCYCSYPVIEGCSSRWFDPAQVADDMERLSRLGARYAYIVDSVFNTSVEHVTGVCEEMIRRKTGVAWGCFLRPSGITRQLVHLMARAGARHIEFGSDSFSDTVLQRYGKGFTFDEIVTAHEHAQSAQIHAAHFLILGGPGENEKTIGETHSNSMRLKRTVFFPFVGMRVYPGTPLRQYWNLESSTDAPVSDLLEPVFYFSPAVSPDRVRGFLTSFSAESPRWQIGQPGAHTLEMMARLRLKGVVGPLWEYLAS